MLKFGCLKCAEFVSLARPAWTLRFQSLCRSSRKNGLASELPLCFEKADYTTEYRNKISREDQNGDQSNDDVVTPWNVTTNSARGVNYEKVMVQFGCQALDRDLVTNISNLSKKKAHLMLRRGLFYAHRGLDTILENYQKFGAKTPFYLYTGRGASSGSLHLGHLIPFMFTKYFQEAFDVPLIIQMTDDEKFLWKDMSLEEAKKMAINNVKDIIAVGFDPAKTFIFIDTDYICPALYANMLKISKSVTVNQVRAIFGFTGKDSVGKISFPAVEVAPCFSSSFPQVFNSRTDVPCLIPCAIDQDPYFRMGCEVAKKLKYAKPSTIYSKFLPSLRGVQSKMSSSEPNSCIFMDDTPNQIRTKINKYGFSGGRETMELHKKLGGNCDVDVSFQFLQFFFDDDDELEQIRQKYSSGVMLTSELKKITIGVVQKLVTEFQERRKQVTDETVMEFTKVRKLAFNY
uniref:Tryptophan--tRNA ligase, cytoplasmic n=1 Tax=Ditylenchus dipsaci TaxID=166011 RepID=A0A915DPC2_9BILA